jgi:hypothetical protein
MNSGQDNLSWIRRGVFSLLLSVFGLQPLLLLPLAGGIACLPSFRTSRVSLSALPFLTIGSGILTTTASFSVTSLFLIFLKLGATVFGSGYVLLGHVRTDRDRLDPAVDDRLSESLGALPVGGIVQGHARARSSQGRCNQGKQLGKKWFTPKWYPSKASARQRRHLCRSNQASFFATGSGLTVRVSVRLSPHFRRKVSK